MDTDLVRNYRRWLEADEQGRDDDADAALMATVEGLDSADSGVSAEFTANVLAAVSASAERDARLARLTRLALTVGAVVGALSVAYFAGWRALSAFSSALAWSLDVLVGLIVRTAMAMRTGGGLWSVVTSLGRAAAAFASDPTVTFLVLIVQGIAFGALVALHRLLGSDREWLK